MRGKISLVLSEVNEEVDAPPRGGFTARDATEYIQAEFSCVGTAFGDLRECIQVVYLARLIKTQLNSAHCYKP